MTNSPTHSATAAVQVSIPARAAIAAAAFGMGLMLFLATGFAWPSAIHNATHDTRHALGLPCH